MAGSARKEASNSSVCIVLFPIIFKKRRPLILKLISTVEAVNKIILFNNMMKKRVKFALAVRSYMIQVESLGIVNPNGRGHGYNRVHSNQDEYTQIFPGAHSQGYPD
jgi:hypothetical protein